MPNHRKLLALLTLPLVVLLAGCMKFESTVTISSNDTVDFTLLLAIQKEYASLLQEACSEDSDATLPAGAVEQYSDEEYVGCTMTANGAPIDKLDAGDGSWVVTHQDGQYRFAMASSDSQSADTPELTSAMFDSFRVSVTFPGEVTSHSGASIVEGTTVTWTDPSDLFGGEGLSATSNEASLLKVALPWVLGVMGLLAVVGVVVVLARRAQPAVPAAPAPAGDPGLGTSHGAPPTGNPQ